MKKQNIDLYPYHDIVVIHCLKTKQFAFWSWIITILRCSQLYWGKIGKLHVHTCSVIINLYQNCKNHISWPLDGKKVWILGRSISLHIRKILIICILFSLNHDYTKYEIGKIITHAISSSSRCNILRAINCVPLSSLLAYFIHHFYLNQIHLSHSHTSVKAQKTSLSIWLVLCML